MHNSLTVFGGSSAEKLRGMARSAPLPSLCLDPQSHSHLCPVIHPGPIRVVDEYAEQ